MNEDDITLFDIAAQLWCDAVVAGLRASSVVPVEKAIERADIAVHAFRERFMASAAAEIIPFTPREGA